MRKVWVFLQKGIKGLYQSLVYSTPDWDFIKSFFRSPLFNVVALLPILGFMLVEFGNLSESQTNNDAETNYIQGLSSRIVDIYWGSYLYLSAFIIYLLDCPPIIRSSKHEDAFRDVMRLASTPRLTIDFIFQAAREESLFGQTSKETIEFVDCVRIWINRVLGLSPEELNFYNEREYLLNRISGDICTDSTTQDRIIDFKNVLLDLSVKHHKKDPWVRELNDNIASIFYRENSRKPTRSRLLCLAFITVGTLSIFGSVIYNHVYILAEF